MRNEEAINRAHKNREPYIDIVKAITIILVVVGHCIQYGSGRDFLSSSAFFENKVFVIIYSFHMPLFMVISGYLFAYSAQNIHSNANVKSLLIKKAKQLIIPLLSWSFVSLIISIVKLIVNGNMHEISAIWAIKRYFSGFIGGPWFLWAIWWCSFVVIIVKRYFKDSPLVYCIGLIVTFFIPDELGLAQYKFMYPFFVLSYWFNAYEFKAKLKKYYHNLYFAIGIIISYVLLLKLFDYDTYIYTSGYTLLGKDMLYQLWNDCFRFIIGLLGSISTLYIIKLACYLCKDRYAKWMLYIGKNTLGVYLISGILLSDILPRVTSNLTGVNYIYILIESIIAMGISLLINSALQKNKTINMLFLGGR